MTISIVPYFLFSVIPVLESIGEVLGKELDWMDVLKCRVRTNCAGLPA